jgi:hypothetical protein
MQQIGEWRSVAFGAKLAVEIQILGN